jgi:hypothetical protein
MLRIPPKVNLAPRLTCTSVDGVWVAESLRCGCGANVRAFPKPGAAGDFQLLCDAHLVVVESLS